VDVKGTVKSDCTLFYLYKERIMQDYIAIVGLDESESQTISERLSLPTLCHVTLPEIMVKDGVLLMENKGRPKYVPVSKVIYHAIYENDLDFITGWLFGVAQLCRIRLG
jgi:hypothetical protein